LHAYYEHDRTYHDQSNKQPFLMDWVIPLVKHFVESIVKQQQPLFFLESSYFKTSSFHNPWWNKVC